jgi:small subunit ribosomal protein S6
LREYELTVIYDLAVSEAGGAGASIEALQAQVENRGGRIVQVDHWGRRRMAYPIRKGIDGDYLVARVELEPARVSELEAALAIDERVYRHLVVRADELPPPPQPREQRRRPLEADSDQQPAGAAVAVEAGAAKGAAPEAPDGTAEAADADPRVVASSGGPEAEAEEARDPQEIAGDAPEASEVDTIAKSPDEE